MTHRNNIAYYALLEEKGEKTDIIVDGVDFQIKAVHHQRSPIDRINKKFKLRVALVLRVDDTTDLR